VISSSRAFTIVVPHGFRNDIQAYAHTDVKLEVLVAGATTSGFTVNINVVRAHIGKTTLATVTSASIAQLKRAYGAGRFSSIQDLTVAGEPARAVSYFATFGGANLLHDRQVYLVRDGWAYTVTYSALSGSQYSGSMSALSECLTSWRWR